MKGNFLRAELKIQALHRRWDEAHQGVKQPAMERAPADTMISNQLSHCTMDTAARVCSDGKKQQRIRNQQQISRQC